MLELLTIAFAIGREVVLSAITPLKEADKRVLKTKSINKIDFK